MLFIPQCIYIPGPDYCQLEIFQLVSLISKRRVLKRVSHIFKILFERFYPQWKIRIALYRKSFLVPFPGLDRDIPR